MRKHYYLYLALFIVCGLWSPQQAKGCLDPDSVIVFVTYDTLNTTPCPTANQVELRISNIRLMSETPGKLCACGLASTSEMFGELLYIAFVDSGTNKPYKGFGKFDINEKSSGKWKGVYGKKGDWSGFVASVVNSGLKSTEPVELIVRAKAPLGISVTIRDSTPCENDLIKELAKSSLGTDEWDGVNEDLKGAHQMVRSLQRADMFLFEEAKYFTELDDELLTALSIDAPVVVFKNHDLTVYPNPSNGRVNLDFDLVTHANIKVTWVDLTGRETELTAGRELSRGEHRVTLSLTDFGIQGTGFLQVSIGDQISTHKVLSL